VSIQSLTPQEAVAEGAWHSYWRQRSYWRQHSYHTNDEKLMRGAPAPPPVRHRPTYKLSWRACARSCTHRATNTAAKPTAASSISSGLGMARGSRATTPTTS
jgi:hypothetical protein